MLRCRPWNGTWNGMGHNGMNDGCLRAAASWWRAALGWTERASEQVGGLTRPPPLARRRHSARPRRRQGRAECGTHRSRPATCRASAAERS